MASIVDTVMAALTPDIVAKLAGDFGEAPEAVTQGLSYAVPTLMSGVIEAVATPTGLAHVLPLIENAPTTPLASALADPAARTAWETAGKAILPAVFPDTEQATATVIGRGVGLKTATETGLLTLAAPLVMAALKQAVGPTPTAAGLKHLLALQEAEVARAMPGELGKTLLDDVPPAKLDAPEPPPANNMLRWVLIAAAAIVAILVLAGFVGI